ncbi:3-hydroxyacyl-CoA dehydrogenase NAD-binding domain-containing protein [Gayadomonas joobiniege]|uniref:3-hydroxyacyl-CoA dehydrogenase NAD-binding domain-containing protein n=1 Tax=Gayadomonas joobiniege TaxID=1234606 RepID=UPI00037ECF2E|nr:3-hydroxyacyl-CoA dehydrogenase NAD-binding domain-containing protein [Gayadomonas joobiniege]
MLYQGNNLYLKRLESNILQLVFASAKGVNVYDSATLAELASAIQIIKQKNATGLIISSDCPAFIAGADITEFLAKFKQPEPVLKQWLAQICNEFNQLEDLPFPTVSAINGFAYGGGCETLLTTDYRIADQQASIGLPEVKLGIMPGFGGSVRLPRLIGLDNALEMILTGRAIDAKKALQLTLVDAVVSTDKLLLAAIDCIHRAASGDLDWQQKRAAKLQAVPIAGNERQMCLVTHQAKLASLPSQNHPAPHAALRCIEKSLDEKRAEALLNEHAYFSQLVQTPQATALVRVFLHDQAVKKKAKKAHNTGAVGDSILVCGAGIMGSGIAYQALTSGLNVTLFDSQISALKRAEEKIQIQLQKDFKMGRLKPARLTELLAKLAFRSDLNGLPQQDYVIEAIVEQKEAKQNLLKQIAPLVSKQGVLLSNTSSISIGELAQALPNPRQFCGLHFFNPVQKMPLVEIIKQDKATEKTLSKTHQLAKRLAKTPVEINDGAGFLVNRILFAYLNAVHQLFLEGASIEQVDLALSKQFGWPMGPCELLDIIGLDTAASVQSILTKAYPERMPETKINLFKLLSAQQRLGKKTAAGFYQYQADKHGVMQKRNDGYLQQLQNELNIKQQNFSSQQIIDRCLLPFIFEAVYCLQENLVSSVSEVEIAALYGLGFPAFRGGPICYLEQTGIATIINKANKLKPLSAAYQVPPKLTSMAVSQRSFFEEA